MKTPGLIEKSLASPKGRRLKRFIKNMKITVLCGLMTILVLRGTIGAGKFGTPAQDYEEIRAHIRSATREYHSARVLSQVKDETLVDNVDEAEEMQSGPEKPYSLGPKISDWDSQREQWLSENAHIQSGKAPRMLLVTGSQPSSCENSEGDHFLLKSIKNKLDYARLHNIEIFYNMAHLDQEMAGFWAKLPLLRKLMLTNPEVEWIWWMDSDALFTDMSFEVPIEKYKDYNLVLHGFDDKVYRQKLWTGLNTGSFLIRNCQWSLDLLDAWAPMGPKGVIRNKAGELLSKSLTGRTNFEADDQSALVYLLITQRQEWATKVLLENSYYLHGYWLDLVGKYEENMAKSHPGFGDKRWPFITHFVGCKPCLKNGGDYPIDVCFKQMERAFTFADNQILDVLGFRHRKLGSPRVVRVRDDTSHPLKMREKTLDKLMMA
jgi:xyloglucan 6-xylosyltransferase